MKNRWETAGVTLAIDAVKSACSAGEAKKGWARRPSPLAGATVSSLSSRTKASGRSIGWDDANMSVSDRAAPRATMICGSRGTIT